MQSALPHVIQISPYKNRLPNIYDLQVVTFFPPLSSYFLYHTRFKIIKKKMYTPIIEYNFYHRISIHTCKYLQQYYNKQV